MSREGAGGAPGAGRGPELRSRRAGPAAVPGQPQAGESAPHWRGGRGSRRFALGAARLSRSRVSPTAVGCLCKYVFPPGFVSCFRVSKFQLVGKTVH